MPKISTVVLSVFLALALNITICQSAFGLSGLAITPLRSELEISPGTQLDGMLEVSNLTKDAMIVDFTAEEFSVINQQYDYAFTVESNVAKWVSFDLQEIILEPGASQKVNFTVGVPLSAEPGGRYIGLFASTNTNKSDDGISSRQRITSLLYISVTGNVTRAGSLLSLTAPWLLTGNSKWSAAIQNTGTTHFRSRYSVSVKGLFGREVNQKTSGDALILPRTVRLISDDVSLPIVPGIYQLVYMIGLGDTPAVAETRFFVYAPVWSILLIIISVLIIIILFRKKSRLN